MRLTLLLCTPIALSSIFSTTATAEVVESGAMTMKIKEVIELAAPVDRAYASFLKIGSWWDKEHTFSGDAANLSLDARPGGCFCETLPNGGGVLHLTVVFIAPNQRVTLSGALGAAANDRSHGSAELLVRPEAVAGPTRIAGRTRVQRRRLLSERSAEHRAKRR